MRWSILRGQPPPRQTATPSIQKHAPSELVAQSLGRLDAFVGVGDNAPFDRRLAETIAWCAHRADARDPATSLRSDELHPWVLEGDRVATIHRVAHSRELRTRAPELSHAEGLGRLLVYFPDQQLADGAAEDASGGFFDIDNTPPWDTWIAVLQDDTVADDSSRDYLVTWVPEQLVAAAQRGIDVNPEECILWLADSRVPITEALSSLDVFKDAPS